MSYYGDETDLLVIDIGTFKGEVPIQEGPAFIQITADGDWTLHVEE